MTSAAPTTAPPPAEPAPVVAWISTLARWLLGGVLIASGAMKMVDLPDSAAVMRAYQVMPDPIAGFVGTVGPFLIIVLGLSLMAGAFTRIAAVVTAVLGVTFLGFIGSAAARGLHVDCGCFGGGGEVVHGQATYPAEAFGAATLLALSAWLIARPRSRFSFDRVIIDEPPARVEDREASLL